MSQKRITSLEAKMSANLLHIQKIVDSIDTVGENPRLRKLFIAKAAIVNNVRTEFIRDLENLNELKLSLTPPSEIDYSLLGQFDELYAQIKCAEQEFSLEPPDKSSKEIKDVKEVKLLTKVRLPKLELPSFDGSIEEWPRFYETFKHAIHENVELNDAERVQYLTGRLTGKALKICHGINPVSENYQTLWKTLCDKYNDKRALAISYLDQLCKLCKISSSSSSSLETFVDKYSTLICAIKQLKIENLLEYILVHLGLKCLDASTVSAFEATLKEDDKFPDTVKFISFLRDQQRIQNRTDIYTMTSNRPINNSKSKSQYTINKTFVNTFAIQCPICGNNHGIYECEKFKSQTAEKRYATVKNSNVTLCINCLSDRHKIKDCTSKHRCKVCNKSHHSLLHFDKGSRPKETYDIASPTREQSDGNRPNVSTVSLYSTTDHLPTNTILLGTATILAKDVNGHFQKINILLDCGSQSEIITKSCCDRLGLQSISTTNTQISGLGNSKNNIYGFINLIISSRIDKNAVYQIQPIVVNRITNKLPTTFIPIDNLKYITDFKHQLADPNFNIPKEIDMILGSDIFAQVVLDGKIRRALNEPVAFETTFGYVVMGKIPTSCNSTQFAQTFCTFAENDEVCLSRFFQIEDISVKLPLTLEERDCEDKYVHTVTRDATGRYEVALPFKNNTDVLGESYNFAKQRYLSLERRLLKQPKLKLEYDAIFKEYLEKKYISIVESNSEINNGYIIPHHMVIRADKQTTKCRMVLNASMKTSSGVSLNEILHRGENLQSDLFKIILNFRLFKLAVCADIKQMYLQIIVQEEFRKFQRVLYRFGEDEEIKLFEFNRVTFGMTCSPYLAMRTIKQLAIDERDRFPLASSIIEQESFYMDDLAVSFSTVDDAVEQSKQLIDLFKSGGFDLVKFSSNSREFMRSIPITNTSQDFVDFNEADGLKVLGLRWMPASDCFTFVVSEDVRQCTKRNILSVIARLWDVMGLVAPVTLLAKLIVKSLWEAGIGWDEIPPPAIATLWEKFRNELPSLQQITVPRHIGVHNECIISLLGCSDASERAYGAVIYVHISFPNSSQTATKLLCARSRVSPVRTESIARLELCSALLLATLMRTVLDAYQSRCIIQNIYAFCDSTIALSWINAPPSRWQTFVANRVAKIQNNISSDRFFHIRSADNPADCLSRGLLPSQLLSHPLWFHGPPFANLPVDQWPLQRVDTITSAIAPEAKVNVLLNIVEKVESFLPALVHKVSSWRKLLHIVIYICRFGRLLPGNLSPDHYVFAENKILAIIQQTHFQKEIELLKKNKPLPPAMAKLQPFIHEDLLRVGGRLSNSMLDFDRRHPVLLPHNERTVELIINHYHQIHLHTGPNLLMSLLRQKYWILSARSLIRKCVHKCNVCFKANPKPHFPLMGELPSHRVQEAKAFAHTGVDYAGPLAIVPYRKRGVHSQKAYLCLFVCLVTKAVHLELASDLSTEVFLNALKRFISRRGPLSCIYSDRGTNFIGAKSNLDALYSLIHSSDYDKEFKAYLMENRINFRFNPAYSPHFGGIWESNVKCVKSYLSKIVGNQLLTYEEMQTVLVQIEALLNSRPLSVLDSSDTSAPLPLTPAHFLNLMPVSNLPITPISDRSLNNRKLLLDQIIHSFWNRWRTEYLHTLQMRQKWTSQSENVREGVVVLLKGNTPPFHWPLGVIHNLHPGKDGVVRVVDVRTSRGLYRRSVTNLCPLPTQ